MKRFIFFLCIIAALALLAFQVFAAPFLVCSPYTGATLTTGQTFIYNVAGLPTSFTSAANIPPDSTGTYAFALDLSTLPVGAYTVTADVCINDPTWGQACSPQSAPFSFTRPAGLSASPSTLGLSITK